MEPIFSTVSKIAGVTVDNRQELLSKLSEGEILTFKHQPNNKHDKNAIAIYNSNDQQLGFINSTLAAEIAEYRNIDPNLTIEGHVKSITGGGDLKRGCNIVVEVMGNYKTNNASFSLYENDTDDFDDDEDNDNFNLDDYETTKERKQREITTAKLNMKSYKKTSIVFLWLGIIVAIVVLLFCLSTGVWSLVAIGWCPLLCFGGAWYYNVCAKAQQKFIEIQRGTYKAPTQNEIMTNRLLTALVVIIISTLIIIISALSILLK